VKATEEIRGEAIVSLVSTRSARLSSWPATDRLSTDIDEVPRPAAVDAAEAEPDAAHSARAAVAAVRARRGRRVTERSRCKVVRLHRSVENAP
jgi:hypothetical protein